MQTVKMPNRRHIASRVTMKSQRAECNTVVLSFVNLEANIEAIRRGSAIQRGNDFEINGRVYRMKASGRVFPVSGPGTRHLNRQAFRALGVHNELGLTETAEKLLDMQKIPQEAREQAREVYERDRG